MVIDLTKCTERALEVHDRFDLTAQFAGYPEVESIEPLEARLRVSASGSGRFIAEGSFLVSLRAYCMRCLESFPVSLGGGFHLTVLPESARPAELSGEQEMRSDEVDVSYYREDRLDVLPLLEEQVNLAMPMRFLCSDGCRGLCQYCGENRNRRDCGCHAPTLDPRLEVLKSLLH